MRALGANTVKQARQGETWTVAPRRCRESARRVNHRADGTIGGGEVKVVATETGSRQSDRPRRDRKNGMTH
jgi:hypothetical protein